MVEPEGMDEADFQLAISFGIDKGELDELRRQECFVLGFELSDIHHLLRNVAIRRSKINRLVHAENKERIERFCAKYNRRCEMTFHENDPSESWLRLTIYPEELPQEEPE